MKSVRNAIEARIEALHARRHAIEARMEARKALMDAAEVRRIASEIRMDAAAAAPISLVEGEKARIIVYIKNEKPRISRKRNKSQVPEKINTSKKRTKTKKRMQKARQSTERKPEERKEKEIQPKQEKDIIARILFGKKIYS